MILDRIFKTLLAALIAATLAACASTKPTAEWINESYSGQVSHVLIIGATRRNERRREFESQFVNALEARGVSATASYKLLPTADELTRESVEAAIRGKDIDAVLVTRLAAIKSADVVRRPANYDYDRDYITYYDHSLRRSSPVYDDEYRVLGLETNLYDVASTELIWKMQSQAITGSRQGEVIATQIELTIKALQKRKLIDAR
jgi:hypothetical protein